MTKQDKQIGIGILVFFFVFYFVAWLTGAKDTPCTNPQFISAVPQFNSDGRASDTIYIYQCEEGYQREYYFPPSVITGRNK